MALRQYSYVTQVRPSKRDPWRTTARDTCPSPDPLTIARSAADDLENMTPQLDPSYDWRVVVREPDGPVLATLSYGVSRRG